MTIKQKLVRTLVQKHY